MKTSTRALKAMVLVAISTFALTAWAQRIKDLPQQARGVTLPTLSPQPQVSDAELATLVRYVREMQQANGIVYTPHQG